MTAKLPALIPDRNSASGFRVEYVSIEVDAELARVLNEAEDDPTAGRMLDLAHDIRQADLERCRQIVWSNKDLLIKALRIAASSLPRPTSNTQETK